MSKARELASLGNAYSDGALSNRNVLINGNFDVWQRGISFTASAGTFGPDRWFVSNVGTGGAGNISQQAFTAGQTDVPNEPAYFMRYSQTTASSDDRDKIYQRIEDVRTLAGQTATLSFYAKANAAKTFYVRIGQNFGSGGSSGNNTVVGSYNVTTSWQKFTLTFDVPSISGKTIGSSSWVGLCLAREEGSYTTFDIDVSQVQLEVGDTATPFEHRSIGQELALCQRYYELGNGYAGGRYSDNLTIGSAYFSTAKRAIPSVSLSGSNSPTVVSATASFIGWYAVGLGTNYSNQMTYIADAEL